MRFVNVTVSDIAPLLECHAFESKSKAIERIRRRGGIRWRSGSSSSHGRNDQYGPLRALPASREYEDRLIRDPLQFLDNAGGQDKLIAVEDRIRSDALGMALDASPGWISSFVNTEFGKAMERQALSRVEDRYGFCVQDRQRPYKRIWTHPKIKSIKVCLVGCVDATFRDSRGNDGILEIKCRRYGFRAFRLHETIQLRTYLTLTKRDWGILVQSHGRDIRKKVVKRDDDWFYRRVKPVIDRIALHITRQSRRGSQRRQCHSKGNA